MKATVEQLAKIGIFASLNRTELERLQEHTAIRTYRQGEVVMYEGDRIPEKLYTLLSGSLRVAKTAPSGKETILRTLSQGDIFAAPPTTFTPKRSARAIELYPKLAANSKRVSPG